MILTGPLPDLAPGDTRQVVGELRAMATPGAQTVWRHPGWASLLAWIVARVPHCDPTVAGVHAIRRAPVLRRNPGAVAQVASYVLRTAEASPSNRSAGRFLGLDVEPADTWQPCRPASASLATEAAELLRRAGIRPCPPAWETISASVDIAVDWWAGFATSTGLGGEALVAAARDAAAMCSEWRLRRHLQGPAGRPLVALLLGGDQWGRSARRACGHETSLVLWALQARRARQAGGPEPVPPAPVVRAWATTVQLIEEAITPLADPDMGVSPTVAA
ncbi:MAG: hypothetical protein ACRDZQ_01965 [Acidimicrobiales bacterium]